MILGREICEDMKFTELAGQMSKADFGISYAETLGSATGLNPDLAMAFWLANAPPSGFYQISEDFL